MMIEKQYVTEEERYLIVQEMLVNGLVMVRESNISSGNFMIFATEAELQPKPTDFEVLQQENTLLKSQIQALSELSDFHEELIVELAMMVYQ